MTKFHVGDRWEDQHGGVWIVVGSATTSVTAALIHSKHTRLEMFGPIDGNSAETGLRLTRLISSERWVPFAEMLPDSADDRPGQMLVVEYATDTPSLFISRERDEGRFEWCERWGDNGYERLTPSDMRAIGGTHWRYLTPPESS